MPEEASAVRQQPSVDTSTRLVWLLGHPVSHSLSPRMHNAAFREQNVNLHYLARDVPPEGLSGAVFDLRSPHVRGANVTVPYKSTVIPLLDALAPKAAKVGAVNTVVNDEGRLCGHNTDVDGFTRALRAVLPAGARGLACLVLGAGGAARAVVAALLEEGADQVFVANRDIERAVALCLSASAWGPTHCVAFALHQASTLTREADLIVNATSLGLPDSVKDFPIDVDTLHSGQVLIDLVYGTEPTALVAGSSGARALSPSTAKRCSCNRRPLSYRLWTGVEPPLDVMRESIDSL